MDVPSTTGEPKLQFAIVPPYARLMFDTLLN